MEDETRSGTEQASEDQGATPETPETPAGGDGADVEVNGADVEVNTGDGAEVNVGEPEGGKPAE